LSAVACRISDNPGYVAINCFKATARLRSLSAASAGEGGEGGFYSPLYNGLFVTTLYVLKNAWFNNGLTLFRTFDAEHKVTTGA
jgi:hypothetical protein